LKSTTARALVLLAQVFPDASASLAQLVEQLTLNQFVSGSSPERGTSFLKPKKIKALRVFSP
jgi:hypothetical protein